MHSPLNVKFVTYLFIILSYSVTKSKKTELKGLKRCYKLHIVIPAEITWSDQN